MGKLQKDQYLRKIDVYKLTEGSITFSHTSEVILTINNDIKVTGWYDASVLNIGEDIILAGGYMVTSQGTFSNRVVKYTPSTNQFKLLPDLVKNRAEVAAMFAIGEILYLAGGNRRSDQSMESLNLTQNNSTWRDEEVQLPTPIHYMPGIVLNENVYIFSYNGIYYWHPHMKECENLVNGEQTSITEPGYSNCILSSNNNTIWRVRSCQVRMSSLKISPIFLIMT